MLLGNDTKNVLEEIKRTLYIVEYMVKGCEYWYRKIIKRKQRKRTLINGKQTLRKIENTHTYKERHAHKNKWKQQTPSSTCKTNAY